MQETKMYILNFKRETERVNVYVMDIKKKNK